MVSMKDIARECHVSVASVSKALNDYPDIGQETKNLILKTAHDMGYYPNSSARTLKTKRSYNLGVLFADATMNGLTHEYFNHVLEGFKYWSEEAGYDVTFIARPTEGMGYYERCRYRAVDGVLVACINYYEDNIQDLIRSDLPVVTIDHTFEGRISVVSNNVQGVEELVTYVHKMGHRRIAFIHGDDSPITRNRVSSFYRTTQRLGLEVPDEYVKEGIYRNIEAAAKATQELLDLPKPPTCIMYPDDCAAIGGLNVIRQRGLKVPEDISITGYDGISMLRMMEPQLTTLCQDTRKIGKTAAKQLISLIEHPKTTLIDRYVVDGVLFTGSSVRQI